MSSSRVLPATLFRRRCASPLACFALALASVAPAHASPRLDREVRPRSQDVALEVDPARPDYRGSVTIELEVARPVASFRMHSRGPRIERVTLTGAAGAIAARADSVAPDQVAIVAPAALASGRYTLRLEFSAGFSRRAAALYRLQHRGDWYAYTQFEATEAREAFPCFDEPEFKIPWQLTLTVPAPLTAVSNTPIERETTEGAARRVVFARSRPLPSYLIAIAVGPFDTVPILGLSVPGRVVTPRGDAALAAEAAQVTPAILGSLERYFGRPYPYEKLDLIAAPEFLYGAMENAGAVIFADRRLLLGPRASAENHRQMRSVVAHELAHMWFGDFVTMRWWDDLWLNESFASWMARKVMDEVFPDCRDGQGILERTQRAMDTDSRPSTGAMRRPIESEENLSSNANELTYSKGQSVLTMFEGWLGPERFRAGVLRYLEAHAWGNATGSDLWTALSQASGENVNAAMESFLDQPGLPLVTIEDLGARNFRLRQQRFLSSGDAGTGSRWIVPVVLAYPAGERVATHRVWLRDSVMDVSLPGAARPRWVLPNAGASGYYVWDAGAEALAAMVADRERLGPIERVGLIRNLGPLLRSGRLHADRYLEILSAFRDDPEPEVAHAALQALRALRDPLVPPSLEESFAERVRAILGPALERVGFESRARELNAVARLRPQLLLALGDLGRDPAVRTWADRVARRMVEGREPVEGWRAEAALPLAMQHADAALWTRVRDRFEAARLPEERAAFLDALGSVRDPRLVEETLRYLLEGPTRPQEIYIAPARLSEYEENREIVFRWAREHYAEVLKRMPAHLVTRMMPMLRGCSAERIALARQFFGDPAHTFPGARFTLERQADAVADCVRLHARESERFEGWLQGTTGRP